MTEILALDVTGARLGLALEQRLPEVRRTRRRRSWLAGVAGALIIAAPAAGTATDWAGLAGGETALPTQAAPGLRVTLLDFGEARIGGRLEAYRARLADDGRTGLCVFLSGPRGGAGRCVPENEVGDAVLTGGDLLAGGTGGVLRGRAVRAEVTVRDRPGRPARVVAVAPAAAPVRALRARALPEDLRPFAVVGPLLTVGVRVLDADGRTLAQDGRPAPPRPDLPAQRSPLAVELEKGRP